MIIIILQIVGTVLILAELIIPSFGFLTMTAIAVFGTSYYIVFKESPNSLVFLVILNLFLIPATLIFGVKKLRKTKISLEDAVESVGFVAQVKINESGIAITDLRPAGTANINGKNVDVYSDSGYILKGTKVRVVSTENAGVKVAAISETG
jgi:membrane-bound serine protease (ClpP class)